MFNSVVLDVVIGLVFIYLLYSLLASIIQEIISTNIGLRASVLKIGIARMLDDETKKDSAQKLLSSAFNNHPLIKHLGKKKKKFLPKWFSRGPSYINSKNFSKVIIDLLRGDQYEPGQAIAPLIQKALQNGQSNWIEGVDIEKETLSYLKSLWADSQGDVEQFKLGLENWFDDTMERVSGWYKKRIQFILFGIGFFIAVAFNVDTISIVQKLSNDDKAREQLVSMANAYIENNPQLKYSGSGDSIRSADEYKQRMDSLFDVKKVLDKDIAQANTILGLGGWPPSEVLVSINTVNNKPVKVYTPYIDEVALSKRDRQIKEGSISFCFFHKVGYLIRLTWYHFFGFLLTAIAISMGAPFWFDLLNKLMKLRGSVQQKKDSGNTNRSTPTTQI